MYIYIYIYIYIQCTFADTSECFCYACHLPSHHIQEAACGRPPLWIHLYGGRGGGKHSNNIQTYQNMCIGYAYWCIHLPYSCGVPIIPYPKTSLVLDPLGLHEKHVRLPRQLAPNCKKNMFTLGSTRSPKWFPKVPKVVPRVPKGCGSLTKRVSKLVKTDKKCCHYMRLSKRGAFL